MLQTRNYLKSIAMFILFASVGFAALLYGAYPTLAATAPPLGLVQQFGALGGSGVTGATGSGVTVDGDVGSSPTATIINFPPSSVTPEFTLHATNDGDVQQARVDATIAALDLASQGPGTVLPAQLDGQVLTAGSYSFTSSADLAAGGTLTLNGSGVFVFNVNTALTANVLSNVVGTADPCNVFWRVGTSATLNGDSFFGTVIAATGFVTVGSGANVNGRVIAATAVTMAGAGGNTIGGCSSNSMPPVILMPEPPLPTGTVGEVFDQNITPSGGDGGPFTCSVTSGVLPDGLMISSDGMISGTPTLSGAFPFTVTCMDNSGNSGSKDFTIVINPADCPPITLLPSPPLQSGTVGQFYTQALTAVGGEGPYTFSFINGFFPDGLGLSNGGLISGTPTLPGAFPFEVTVTDANGCMGLQAYIIVIFASDVPVGTPIPTLSEWGLIAMAGVLGIVGYLVIRRRKVTA
ncbi:MAG: IPTL-CTERM sorting domain-containing protein [Thermodesulfobacteriota bacterium]